MKTIRVSKKAIALVGTLFLAAIVFFATMIPSPQPAQAEGLLPLPTITVSVPILPPVTVQLPPIVKTVTSVVKDVTVVTKTVTTTKVLPRQTVTARLPGSVVTAPARTVTVNAPAQPQAVKTVTVTQQAGQNGQQTATLPPVTKTASTTAPNGVVTTTVTKEKPVVITRVEAVLSAIALAVIGAIAGMLVLGAYRLGWFRGDSGNREFLENTVDDLKHNK